MLTFWQRVRAPPTPATLCALSLPPTPPHAHRQQYILGKEGTVVTLKFIRVRVRERQTHCSTQQHTATPYNTLQLAATHCNPLQLTATHWARPSLGNSFGSVCKRKQTHCNTLHHTATRCNTLQHTVTLQLTATHWTRPSL